MAFLVLNGVVARVESASMEPVEIGDRQRAISGAMRSTIRAVKREWSCESVPMVAAEARALSGLLRGDGHYWPLDADGYSSKGLGPALGSAAYGATSPAPQWGAGRAAVADYVIWSAPFGASYSRDVDGWGWLGFHWSGAAWEHWLVGRYAAYKDGVAVPQAAPWVFVDVDGSLRLYSGATWEALTQPYSNGNIFNVGEYVRASVGGTTYLYAVVYADDPSEDGVSGGASLPAARGAEVVDTNLGATYILRNIGQDPGTGSGTGYFDDMALYPFVLPADWAAGLDAEHQAAVWAAIPRMRLAGDIVGGVPALVEGQPANEAYMDGRLAGAYQTLTRLSFRLLEV